MTATNDSNEYTTIDRPWLKKDDWLYLSIASGSPEAGASLKERQPVQPKVPELNRRLVMEKYLVF
ncbi:MAG: hypothetical protein PHP04_09580 [Bacteroidales bacterium]|nr:hypothetical protein [Bacteroidales bacterium]